MNTYTNYYTFNNHSVRNGFEIWLRMALLEQHVIHMALEFWFDIFLSFVVFNEAIQLKLNWNRMRHYEISIFFYPQ